MKGALRAGNQISTVNGTNLTVVGNPYASAIDFATLTKNNVKNNFLCMGSKNLQVAMV